MGKDVSKHLLSINSSYFNKIWKFSNFIIFVITHFLITQTWNSSMHEQETT